MRLYQVEYTDSDGDVTEAWYRNRRDGMGSARSEIRQELGEGSKAEVYECHTNDAPAGELVLRALNRTPNFIARRTMVAWFRWAACGKCENCKSGQGSCLKPKAERVDEEQDEHAA